ncbi:MAG: GNAT family N-acetyltransferase [Bryobacteraceae bacterium]|nr:GNAT family N-acetyltransferase [Bryobacteraceae bacterium]
MKGPERILTARLILRRPVASDASEIYSRYASDPEVTKFLGWARHQSIDQTQAFLSFSDADWERWPAGPYLIESKHDTRLLGGTGLGFETRETATTGYVLARDAWGFGYATEALRAMVELADKLGVTRLYSLCHPGHAPSIRVLEKCGFVRERGAPPVTFPNLDPGRAQPCLRFTHTGSLTRAEAKNPE